jgi:AcrR family transcriptional regulator
MPAHQTLNREYGGQVPTGFAIRDARTQLFDAAERVLVRDGQRGLTSRAVTVEAGCAKGVLHSHFDDFDGFLTEFVLDRAAQVEAGNAALRSSAGNGTVAGNLTDVLTALFSSIALEVVGLVVSRNEMRSRLRIAGHNGVPVLNEAAGVLASYLFAERELGRLSRDADVDSLAPVLIGAAHLMFTGRDSSAPEPEAVHKMVEAVISGVSR